MGSLRRDSTSNSKQLHKAPNDRPFIFCVLSLHSVSYVSSKRHALESSRGVATYFFPILFDRSRTTVSQNRNHRGIVFDNQFTKSGQKRKLSGRYSRPSGRVDQENTPRLDGSRSQIFQFSSGSTEQGTQGGEGEPHKPDQGCPEQDHQGDRLQEV